MHQNGAHQVGACTDLVRGSALPRQCKTSQVQKLVGSCASARSSANFSRSGWRQYYTVLKQYVSSKNFQTLLKFYLASEILQLRAAAQHCIIFILDGEWLETKTTDIELSKKVLCV